MRVHLINKGQIITVLTSTVQNTVLERKQRLVDIRLLFYVIRSMIDDILLVVLNMILLEGPIFYWELIFAYH